MKVSIDIEASPAELREFFGLPEVRPLQEELMQRLREQLAGGQIDPMALMRPLLPPALASMEGLQKAMWEALGAAGGAAKPGTTE